MTTSVLNVESLPIPRPEHPHPHWQRNEWMNLNGEWSFSFDPSNEGISEHWYSNSEIAYSSMITVPFSWVSPLSGIGSDHKGIGWYRRTLKWQTTDSQTRLFLRFGAVDYSCDVWINGVHVGSHQGGYGSFEFEVTQYWVEDLDNTIVVRVEDFDHDYQTRGKQGYGEIRGIWQPVWLESRPQTYMKDAKFVTTIDGQVNVTTRIFAQENGSADFTLKFAENSILHTEKIDLIAGENEFKLSIHITDPILWSQIHLICTKANYNLTDLLAQTQSVPISEFEKSKLCVLMSVVIAGLPSMVSRFI